MNVGFVTHYYDRTEGTGGYAVEVVTRLAREHQVTLYAAGVRSDPPAGVTVVRVPASTWRAYATMLTFPRAFARLRRPHDVVHAQGWVTDDADVVTAHVVLAAWREAAAGAADGSGTGDGRGGAAGASATGSSGALSTRPGTARMFAPWGAL